MRFSMKFGCENGAKMEPKSFPKWSQNWLKFHAKFYWFFDWFLLAFWRLRQRPGPLIWLAGARLSWGPAFLTKTRKTIENECQNDQKGLQKRSQNSMKKSMKIWMDFEWILDAFWSPNLMFWEPKCDQKGIKKSIKFRWCFWSHFGGQVGWRILSPAECAGCLDF